MRTSATPARRPGARLLLTTLLAAGLAVGSVAGPAAHATAAPGDPAGPAASADPAAPGTAPAPGSTTWTLEPASAEGPDERVSHRVTADPGQVVADHVALTNFSDHAATFAVYASDGLVTADGQFDLLPAGTEPVDSGAWIVVGDPAAQPAAGEALQVEVAPGASVVLPFTLTVPADATPGDHPAGIVAALVPTQGADQVTFDARVGVRIHLRVSGEVTPALAVSDVTATYEPSWNPFAAGDVHVEYTVTNEGNVRLGAQSTVDAHGPFGWGAQSADGTAQRELLPGQSATSSVGLEAWPLARLTGGVDVVPVVVGEDVVEVTLADAAGSWSLWAVPWAQLALLLLAVGAVVAVVRTRRRREARTEQRIAAAVEAARTTQEREELVDA